MKRKATPIVLVSLLLGLAFDVLFYGKLPGISVFLYTSLILGFTLYFAQRLKNPLNKSIYLLTPVILFFALMVSVRASIFLAVINIFMVIYLLLVVLRLAHQPTIKLSQFEFMQYVNLIGSMPARMLREFFLVLQRSASNRRTLETKSSYVPVLRGAILSLPILFLFLILLSSADLVFKNFVDLLFDFSVAPETVFRWSLIGLVTSLFTGAYALIFMPGSTAEVTVLPDRKKFDLGTTEASIILGSVSSLFFIFVIIQLAYLFGGSGQVVSTGHTYAEYARQGFFELIAVAAISLLLIMTIKKSTKFRTLPQNLAFKWLSGILIAEVMVIMLSAHIRLNLYEDAYGFTTLRLVSHLFILWLACAFTLLVVHIVRDKNERQLAFQLFISTLCFYGLVNLINPDAFIARQNINRFNKTGKLDVRYLSNLSEDAVPTVAKMLNNSNKDKRIVAASILYTQKHHRLSQSTNWQSANLARQRADRIYRNKSVQIENGKSYEGLQELNHK